MITVTVTSDSSELELRSVATFINDLATKRLVGEKFNEALIDAKKPTLSEIAEQAIKISNEVGQFTEPTFNSTELAEADRLSQDKAIYDNPNELGKPVCSTVDASQSTIAHAGIQVGTFLPEPTYVFGQVAQTTVNEANPVAPTTDNLAIDVEGFPWDARIHSSSKEVVKNGTWRKRRGVDDALVKQVEAELRGFKATTPPPVPVAPTPIEVPSTMTFTELLDGVTKAMVAGQLTQARITEALKSIGIEALPHLIARTDLIPTFREALGGVV